MSKPKLVKDAYYVIEQRGERAVWQYWISPDGQRQLWFAPGSEEALDAEEVRVIRRVRL